MDQEDNKVIFFYISNHIYLLNFNSDKKTVYNWLLHLQLWDVSEKDWKH